jgi:hypothetical protein
MRWKWTRPSWSRRRPQPWPIQACAARLLNWLGLELALVALGMGAFFFAYSLKYYLARATMLLLAFFGPGHNENGSGQQKPSGLLVAWLFTFWLIAYRWLVPDLELAGNTNRPIKT